MAARGLEAERSPVLPGACLVQAAGDSTAEPDSVCATCARSEEGTSLLAGGPAASGGARACASAGCSARDARRAGAAPWHPAGMVWRGAEDARPVEVRVGAWGASRQAAAAVPWMPPRHLWR